MTVRISGDCYEKISKDYINNIDIEHGKHMYLCH